LLVALNVIWSRIPELLVIQPLPWGQLSSRDKASKKAKSWYRAGGGTEMLWTVFAILLLLWLLGWGFHIAGSLIHLVVVIALVVLLIEVITGRRAAV
jgi:hypothetical protein